MRRIALALALALAAGAGCAAHRLTTLHVAVTVSPTLHLDGIGRGPDVQAQVAVHRTRGKP